MTNEINYIVDKNLSTCEKIKLFESWGFDQIRFPGGSNLEGSHYSRLVVPKIENRKVYFLMVPYNSKIRTEEKAKKNRYETPEQTAKREAFEELGIIPLESGMARMDPPIIISDTHTQYEFLITEYEGTELEFREGNPTDIETGPPIWISAKELKDYLWHKHMGTFEKAKNILCIDKNYAFLLL